MSSANNTVNQFEEQLKSIVTQILEKEKSAATSTNASTNANANASTTANANASTTANANASTTANANASPANASPVSASLNFSTVKNEDEFKNEIDKFVQQIFKNISDEMTSLNRNRVPNKTNIDDIIKNIIAIKGLIDNLKKNDLDRIKSKFDLFDKLKEIVNKILKIIKNTNLKTDIKNDFEIFLKSIENDDIDTQINKIYKKILDIQTKKKLYYYKKDIKKYNKEIDNIREKDKNIFTINTDYAITIIFDKIIKKYESTNTDGMYINVTDAIITQPGCTTDVICDIQDYYNSITLNLSQLFNLQLDKIINPDASAQQQKIIKVLTKEITNFYSNIINNKYRVGWFGKRMGERLTTKFKVLTSPPQKKSSKIKMKVSRYHVRKDKDGNYIMRPTIVTYETKNTSKLMDIDEQLYRIKKKGKGIPVKDELIDEKTNQPINGTTEFNLK